MNTIDVLVDLEVGLHRIHVTADPVAVARHAQGRLIAQWHVDADLGGAARVAAVDPAGAHLAEDGAHAELGRVRDVAHGAGERPGAEQRPLGAAQHLDAGDVEQVEVRRKQGEGDGHVVQVGAHLLLDPRLVPGDLAGRGAAHGDLALTGAQVLHAEPGHVGRDRLDVLRPPRAQGLPGWGGDGEGNVGQLLLAEHGRDDDLVDAEGGRFQCYVRGRLSGLERDLLGPVTQQGYHQRHGTRRHLNLEATVRTGYCPNRVAFNHYVGTGDWFSRRRHDPTTNLALLSEQVTRSCEQEKRQQ